MLMLASASGLCANASFGPTNLEITQLGSSDARAPVPLAVRAWLGDAVLVFA